MTSRGRTSRSARLVARQLRKSGLVVEPGTPIDHFVELVRRTYAESDDQRRLNDHAFGVASAEMEALNAQLAENNHALNAALASATRSEALTVLNEELSSKNKELSRLANTDSLTGLLNRHSFNRSVRQLAAQLDGGSKLAVALIDLDRFKLINDTFGHQMGDRLLVEMASALRTMASTHEHDLVARLGGDEFAYARFVKDVDDAERFASSLSDALHAPLVIDHQLLHTAASVGLALTDDKDVDPSSLLRDADTAMYRAKANSATRYRIFDHRFRQEVTRRFSIERELHTAIREQLIEMAYQPIVNESSGSTPIIEALARWNSSTLGDVSPVEFIPAIERMGLSAALARQTVGSACRQLQEWRGQHREAASTAVAVNITFSQLIDAGFVGTVVDALDSHGLLGDALVLELTESELLTDFDGAVNTLDRLRSYGVRIAIDDFGTGYSALAYLARLPADFLKIDKSFVGRIAAPADSEESILTQVIVDLARRFDLAPIAEGVETEEQRLALASFGCELLQGYLLSRPVSPAQIPTVLRWSGQVQSETLGRAA